MVSPVLLESRTSRRPAALSWRRAGVNQGAEWVNEMERVFRGAKVVREDERQML